MNIKISTQILNIIVFFFLLSGTLNAQIPDWTIYHTGNSDIPDNWIYALAAEGNTNIWIGLSDSTTGGLVKYDGTNWTVYNTFNSGLPSNFVQSIVIDQSGIMWIGTREGGLAKFDGTNWTVYNTFNSDIPHNDVQSIGIDSSGNKWIGTLDGLAKFNDTTWSVIGGLPNPLISSIAFGQKETKWIGTPDGLAEFDGTIWTIYNTSNSDLPHNIVESIAIDGSGNIWIGTRSGLAKYDKTPFIQVIRPNGGENWQYNSTQNIEWNFLHISDIKIEYTIDNGDSWIIIVESITASAGSYSWQIPLVTPQSNECKIRISDVLYEDVIDESDNPFTLFAKVVNPSFSPSPGPYNTPQTVTISSSTPLSEIYYTIDDTDPNLSSPIYTIPLSVDSSLTLKVRAFRTDWEASDIVIGDYNILDQVINVNIQTENIWYDVDYSGDEAKEVDGIGSTISYGNLTSYIWTVDGDTVAIIPTPSIELLTGTNTLVLTLTGDRGVIERDSVNISVYAAELVTNGPITSAVSQFNNSVFFASSADDKIYSFDSTGTAPWSFQTGGDIHSTNCVKDQNNIYVGSTDTRLYSFDYLGNPNWDKAMGGIILSTPSVGPDGTIYTGINTGKLSAVSESGTFLWSVQTGGAVISSPAVSTNGTIYFGSTDGNLYAVAPSGDTLWTYLTADSIVGSPALGMDSSIVIGSIDGNLYKIKENGILDWKLNSQSKIYSSPVIGVNGIIHIGSNSGYFYSISKEGSENWKYYAGSPIKSTPAIGPDGSIYFGCDDGKFIALNETGEHKWFLQTGQPIIAPPLITEMNLIYIGSTDNKVYIMKDAQASSPKRLSLSQFEWPTFKGNNQRTGYLGEITTSIADNSFNLPKKFRLYQNYPNPFNPSTRIKYALPKSNDVRIEIYNTLGQVIWSIFENQVTAGYHEVEFNAQNLSSGIYFYRIEAGEFQDVKKMVLIR